MNTMNRLYYFYSEECMPAQLEKYELGLCFVHSSIDKHKREDCVLYMGLQEEDSPEIDKHVFGVPLTL